MATVEPDLGTAIIVDPTTTSSTAAAESRAREQASTSARSASRRNRSGVAAFCSKRACGAGTSTDQRPGGLDIGAESPPRPALSMLAEMLAVRVGRAGGALATRRPAFTRNPRREK